MNNLKNIDTILVVNPAISESAYDERTQVSRSTDASPRFFMGSAQWDDPKLYTDMAFGNQLKNRLSSIGSGFGVEVTDYNKWVTVRLTYHDVVSGISTSKTFLVVFQHKGDGIVLNTANRYRTISGVDQAASYIRSVASVLKSKAEQKI